jgi:hypothetical protein
MAIAVYFHPKQMTLEQYAEVHRRLAGQGAADQAHRWHHSCFGPEDDLMVMDIWDSPESFEAFGGVLMPILADVGVDPGEPAVMPLHKVQQSQNDFG